MTHIVIMRGLPGSGKSTYVQEHYPRSSAVVLCPDDDLVGDDGVWRWDAAKCEAAHDRVQAEFEAILGTVPLIVIDRCSLAWAAIEPYAESYRAGHTVELITLHESRAVCWERNIHRVPGHRMLLYSRRMSAARIPAWLKHTQIRGKVTP